MGACAVLGITNQDALSEDLESDPFLNSALQRFTCEFYCRFGSFLASLSIGSTTSRHYLSENGIKNGGGRSDERSNSQQLLQNSCQETIGLLSRDLQHSCLEYLSFLLQCTTTIILSAIAYYLYSLIKGANEIIVDLLLEVSHDPPKSEVERQKLWEKLIPKNRLTSSVLKTWINSSAITKQNFWAKW